MMDGSMASWIAYTAAVTGSLLLVAAWGANLLSLPGNWAMVGLAALAAWILPEDAPARVSWTTVGLLAGLALAGELLEAVAAAGNAARLGGSRRGTILSIVGAMAGSVLGGIAGVPIPVPLLGSAVSAIVGGGAGAFLGAYLGERWKGRSLEEGLAIGRAALLGRFLGTAGKMIVGSIMIVLAFADLWW